MPFPIAKASGFCYFISATCYYYNGMKSNRESLRPATSMRYNSEQEGNTKMAAKPNSASRLPPIFVRTISKNDQRHGANTKRGKEYSIYLILSRRARRDYILPRRPCLSRCTMAAVYLPISPPSPQSESLAELFRCTFLL
jgi:hypothetical protein